MFFDLPGTSFSIVNVSLVWRRWMDESLCNDHHTLYYFWSSRYIKSMICEGEREIPIRQYEMLFIPAGVSYRHEAHMEKCIRVDFLISGATPSEIEWYPREQVQKYFPHFKKLLAEWEDTLSGHTHRAYSLFYEILACLANDSVADWQRKDYPLIKNGVEYLRTHFMAQECSIAEAAKASYISERYFRKIYDRIYGISPAKDLRKMRIRYACQLMHDGGHTVKEVAFLSGFSDAKYFARVFREEKQMSPYRYQQVYSTKEK